MIDLPPKSDNQTESAVANGVAEKGTGSQQTKASAVDELVDHIRTLISEDGLKVGDSLPTEKELCERFDAGRNTVREAMRILKSYGVVKVRPKVGAVLIDERMARAFDLFAFNTLEVSRETFVDIQGFRGLLEVASFELLFDRITPDDIAELHQVNKELLDANSAMEAAEIDFRFHTRLVSVIGNKAILDVYKIMKPVILKIMLKAKTVKTFSTVTYSEHAEVLETLERRDRTAYQYKMKSHLDAGFRNFEAAKPAEQAPRER
ncbi:GntR family transcriptional regulator [Hoeflea halophila]|uniref:GntR family transcriptional regulator n=1 Tax=Hoeflea halophila TaxID=714899 RepID=A0A286IGK5_9HYPH|nr:FCD domain-containing protein [Hoeflea halophila]SOE18464.1 GntR family transcriptional regulator [Hoeflea halophila]